MLNCFKKIVLKKKIKNFNGKNVELEEIINLVKKTDLSLKMRYGKKLVKMKDEIEYLEFGQVVGYKNDQPIKDLIFSIQEDLLRL